MLHNLQHRAVLTADNAAITRSIWHDGRQHRSLGLGLTVRLIQLFQQSACQQGGIPAKYHNRTLGAGQKLLGLQHSVTRAQLLSLGHVLNAALLTHGLTDYIAAEARNHHIAAGPGLLGSIQHMLEHGLACSLMKHLRQLGFHAGSLAGRKDNGNQI